MNIYVLTAEHWYVPGKQLLLYKTSLPAADKAAELVKILRDDIGLRGKVTSLNWRIKLKEARAKRAAKLDIPLDELAGTVSDGYVELERFSTED
jgi:hypothetical protein